jgi:hypothetical protein
LHRLDENLGATGLILSAGELENINRSFAAVTVQGERYPENLRAMTGR